MLLSWDGRTEVIEDPDDLDSSFDQIAADCPDPTLVTVSGPGGTLTLGVGHPEGGLLLFLPANRATPVHSVGDADAGEGEVLFRRGGALVGFFRRCLIAHPHVRAAARSFLATGARPDNVTWEAEPMAP